jgi:hypothetical protein
MNEKNRNPIVPRNKLCASALIHLWAAIVLCSAPCLAQLSTTEQLQGLQSRYDEMVVEFIGEVQRLPDDAELFNSLPAKAEQLQTGELLKLSNELGEAKKLITSREAEINKSNLSVADKNELKTALTAQKKPLDTLAAKAASFKTALGELKDTKLKSWKEVYDSFLSISGPEKATERLRSLVNEFCKPYTSSMPRSSAAPQVPSGASANRSATSQATPPPGPSPPSSASGGDWLSGEWVNTLAEKASGFFGTAPSPRQPPAGSKVLSFQEALRRADQGDAYAEAVVSIYYGTGYLTGRDIANSAEYAIRSARQRNPLGLYRLGTMLQSGEGVPLNTEEGMQLKAASFDGLNKMSGDPYAQTALGIMLFRGENVRRDRAEAARLYRLAADAGYAPAQYNYSACFVAGHGGLPKDPARAELYWRKAYEQGYAPALEGMPR